MGFDGVGRTLLLSTLILVSTGKLFTTVTGSVTTKQVILRSKLDCGVSKPVHFVGEEIDQYRILMKWTRYNCSEYERGLSCSQTFVQKNNFANLGTRLCIDMQGVQYDIRGMNQLLVTVSDREGTLKEIYTTTKLRPEDKPYYVCTQPDQNSITVSITVRHSVKICPSVLEYLFTNPIRLGTVSSMPLNPIATMDLNQCENEDIPRNESLLIKVNAEGTSRECFMRKRLPIPYSYLRGCLKVVYYSDNFECDIIARLGSERNVDTEISVSLDRSPGSEMQQCETFAGRNGLPVLTLSVIPYRYSNCRGQFALSLAFRQTPPPDADDDSDKRSPNLYMAVFITLIAICLVCLGLTCLCCIRFRAKRLRRLQRRNNHRQVSVPNQGFQYDVPNAPPYDNISWSPTEPGMLYGLPSYDDVVAETSGGINPSSNAYKNDLPPAYDSVCSASDS